jgi:Voltage gated chloride channel/SnoaL-like polyketide cyclase
VIRSPASVDQGLVADRGPDLQPRLVQAALERGLADADDLCGLLGRKAFDVSQHDGRPVIRRQFGQGLAQRLAQLCLLLWFLILLAFAKIAATSLSIGIGGSGGILAPLFIGVTSGMAYDDIVRHLFGAAAGRPALYAVVAMGAVFTSTARAPLTSRTTVTGTHTGDLMGMPATGKRIRVEAVDIGRVDDGQAAERWGGLNMYALLTQLGVIPAPQRG